MLFASPCSASNNNYHGLNQSFGNLCTESSEDIVSDLGREEGYIRSNLPHRLKEFRRAKPEGTPVGKGVYLTVYPESSPNTDTKLFKQSLG